VLVTLVEAWERQHYPLSFPDPIEASPRSQKRIQPQIACAVVRSNSNENA
jgi:hypothetical protein